MRKASASKVGPEPSEAINHLSVSRSRKNLRAELLPGRMAMKSALLLIQLGLEGSDLVFLKKGSKH